MKTGRVFHCNRGQTLLELSLSIGLCLPLILGASWFLRDTWRRISCSRAVFESTRAALEGRRAYQPRFWIRIDSLANSTRGSANCGGREESVELPTLEPRAGNL